ncbi:MAG: hypothetical protein LZF62_410214 [Nitrospira sp.]|nr:MAG: hypothetical protein LZF62_410214 [Nitrospira sp.]
MLAVRTREAPERDLGRPAEICSQHLPLGHRPFRRRHPDVVCRLSTDCSGEPGPGRASALDSGERLGLMNRLQSQSVPSPGYLNLRALAVYSSCSVRWLRDRLVDKICPLPHHRVQGKILVKREDFDTWIEHFRKADTSSGLEALVDDVVSGLFSK